MKKIFITILFSAFLVLQIASAPSLTHGQETTVWDSQLPKILEEINKPTFPDHDFYIDDFGALNNDETLSTEAINKAISAAHESGGGRVIVPEGIYLTGAIYLKSNVNLHLEEDAVLKFSQEPSDYLPLVKTRWEGVELYNYSPLIYSHGEENIAITGKGTLDGQADNENWWPWKGKTEYGWEEGDPHQAEARDKLFQMAEDGVPVEERRFGEDSYLRPSFIQPYESENILIEGITLIDSPMWFINPVLSENITVEDVTVVGHGPNNDGANPESSKNVLIKNSHFDTGDDNIAIKSGRNADGRRIDVPSENIVIQGNEMKDGHGAVVIGSEMTGGVRNVFAEDNLMDSPNLDRVLRIKTNSVRGGFAENIFLRNNTVDEVGGEVVRVDMEYEEGDAGNYTPIVRNIEVDNLHSHGGNYGIFIRAYERAPVQNLKITNSSINDVTTPMFVNHVEDMVLENFTINGESYDNTAPETSAYIRGEQLSDGTYLNEAEVRLDAVDEDGVAKTEYRLNNDDWVEYMEPLTITQDGQTTIDYRSIDYTGNRESINSLTLKIIYPDLSSIKEFVEASDIQPNGIKNSINNKLDNAAKDFKKGHIKQGNDKLTKLIQFIQQKSGKHVPEPVANDLEKMIERFMK